MEENKNNRAEKVLAEISDERVGLFGGYYDGALFGLEWADKNPDEEKLRRLGSGVALALCEAFNAHGQFNVGDYLIKHWND